MCGIRDNALQRSLLSVPKLTFDKACELALLHVSAEQNSKVLSAPTSVHRTELHPPIPRLMTVMKPIRRRCYRCGGQHSAKSCHFKDSVCKFCRKKGYIQRVCRSRRRESQQTSAPPKGSQQHGHRLDEAPPPLAGDYTLFAVSVAGWLLSRQWWKSMELIYAWR